MRDDPSPRLLISDVFTIRDLWWSPNGDLLAFLRYPPASGDLEIFVMDVADATVRQLTTDNHGYRHLAWSPDGSRIAYTGKVNDRREILTIDADGADPRQLTREGGYTPIWSPRWQPNRYPKILRYL